MARFTQFVAAILVNLSIAACGASVGDCPPDSMATQTQGHGVVAQRCFGCHSSPIKGSARQNAPENLNFDQLDVVREWTGEILGEAEGGSMPPDMPLPAEQVEQLRVWLACGAN